MSTPATEVLSYLNRIVRVTGGRKGDRLNDFFFTLSVKETPEAWPWP